MNHESSLNSITLSRHWQRSHTESDPHQSFVRFKSIESHYFDLQVASKPGSPEALEQLIEMIRDPSANIPALPAPVPKEDKARLSRDKKVLRSLFCYGCLVSSTYILVFCFWLVQAPGYSLINREDSSLEALEPDPAGFREQVPDCCLNLSCPDT